MLDGCREDKNSPMRLGEIEHGVHDLQIPLFVAGKLGENVCRNVKRIRQCSAIYLGQLDTVLRCDSAKFGARKVALLDQGCDGIVVSLDLESHLLPCKIIG
ncbi:hypothetical protein AN480_03690 [Mycobacterium intracellulare subsp. chimaera]|nr:hypothetical protein AN480_03690 [Mycobacterium intracellulare subsp. chimaera]